MKYSTKPVEVTAIQWNEHGDHASVTPLKTKMANEICPRCRKLWTDHGVLHIDVSYSICPGMYIIAIGGDAVAHITDSAFHATHVSLDELKTLVQELERE